MAALTGLYRTVLPTGGVLLDLMSSWVSHLPPEIGYAEVIGFGLNAAELAANPRLGRRSVRDLNRKPSLPLAERQPRRGDDLRLDPIPAAAGRGIARGGARAAPRRPRS